MSPKEIPALVLALALLCSCAAPAEPSAPSPQEGTELTADAIAQAILASQPDSDDYAELSPTDAAFTIVELYGVTDWTDGAVYTAGGVDAREIAVVRVERRINAMAGAMEDYRQSRFGDFYGYAPEQAELVKKGAVCDKEEWIALLLCADPDAALDAFDGAAEGGDELSIMGGELPVEMMDPVQPVPFDPPNKYDMTPYDTTAVILAWESGERDWLGEKDAAILARCEEIMAQCVTEGMTDLEKELALHDWLIDNVAYDDAVYRGAGRPDDLNPYGALVNGYAICLGYATAFQLLMELAEVECITVPGAAFHSTEDHGWNMVKLDGEWYCVDVTWDSSNSDRYRYFNVTSDFMRQTDHQWDYESVPEAVAHSR